MRSDVSMRGRNSGAPTSALARRLKSNSLRSTSVAGFMRTDVAFMQLTLIACPWCFQEVCAPCSLQGSGSFPDALNTGNAVC